MLARPTNTEEQRAGSTKRWTLFAAVPLGLVLLCGLAVVGLGLASYGKKLDVPLGTCTATIATSHVSVWQGPGPPAPGIHQYADWQGRPEPFWSIRVGPFVSQVGLH